MKLLQDTITSLWNIRIKIPSPSPAQPAPSILHILYAWVFSSHELPLWRRLHLLVCTTPNLGQFHSIAISCNVTKVDFWVWPVSCNKWTNNSKTWIDRHFNSNHKTKLMRPRNFITQLTLYHYSRLLYYLDTPPQSQRTFLITHVSPDGVCFCA